MLRKIISLLCVGSLMLSFCVSAASTSIGFDDGYLPDGLNVVQPKEETPFAGTKIYPSEKMVKVAKKSDTDTSACAVRTFDKIYGPGNIWLTFSIEGDGASYIEFGEKEGIENAALRFEVSREALSYYDDAGEKNAIKTGLNENERYTLKISGTFTKKTVDVALDGGDSVPVNFLTESGAKNLAVMSVYTHQIGSSMELFHFSTDSTGSKYCWDEFQEEDQISKWHFSADEGDTAQICVYREQSYLSMYVAKAGQSWDNGDSINSDVRGTIPNTGSNYKVTIKYSTIGDGESFFRLCRSNGGYWLANLVFTGTTFGYSEDTSGATTPIKDAKSMQSHTVVLYRNGATMLYDLYFDGIPVTINQAQISAGADVFLGYILMQRKNDKPGGIRLYSIEVEDDYSREDIIGEGKFTDSQGNQLSKICEGTITGKYDVTINSSNFSKAMVVMMYYKGNMLKGITATPFSAATGEAGVAYGSIDVPDAEDASVHMFLWNDLNDIVPFTETESVLD